MVRSLKSYSPKPRTVSARAVVYLAATGMALLAADVQAATIQTGPASPNAGNSVWASFTSSEQGTPSSFFTGLGSAIDITAISFIASNASSFPANAVWRLTIGAVPNAITNWNGSATNNLPLADSMTFATQSFSGTTSVGSLVTFNGDFVYRPADGDLVVEETLVSGSAGGPKFYFFSSTGYKNFYNGGTDANASLSMIFTYGAIPEPASLVLLSLGTTALGLIRRRSQHRL